MPFHCRGDHDVHLADTRTTITTNTFILVESQRSDTARDFSAFKFLIHILMPPLCNLDCELHNRPSHRHNNSLELFVI